MGFLSCRLRFLLFAQERQFGQDGVFFLLGCVPRVLRGEGVQNGGIRRIECDVGGVVIQAAGGHPV